MYGAVILALNHFAKFIVILPKQYRYSEKYCKIAGKD